MIRAEVNTEANQSLFRHTIGTRKDKRRRGTSICDVRKIKKHQVFPHFAFGFSPKALETPMRIQNRRHVPTIIVKWVIQLRALRKCTSDPFQD